MVNNKIIRLIKIGAEKNKVFINSFDLVYDFYKKRAEKLGYWGDLKFIKEKGKVFIYVIVEYEKDSIIDSDNYNDIIE